MTTRICEGNCQSHVGAVLKYRLNKDGKDFSYWDLCEQALRDKIEQGYTHEAPQPE